MKKILREQELRQALVKGITNAGQIVAETAGPHGRNVLLGEKNITNDGVSIIKQIEYKDVFENAGVILLKDVAGKTNQEAGDGTTGTIILTKALAVASQKHLESGINFQELRKSIQGAGEEAIKMLKKSAKKDCNPFDVAKISSESEETAHIIDDIHKKIGSDGVITVEKQVTAGIDVEYQQGMEFNTGILSKYMINDKDNRRYEAKDVPVIAVSKHIHNMSDLLPSIEKVRSAGGSELVLFCDDVADDVLDMIVKNIYEKTFNVICIKSPGFENPDLLLDVCTLAGCEDDITSIGKLDSIVSTETKTTISSEADTSERVKELKAREPKDMFDKKKIDKRIASLSGGVAVIKVGAKTEIEARYLQDKLEDAVLAVKSALEEGVIAGGGSELCRIAKKLLRREKIGNKILAEALTAPTRQMAKNAGLDDGVIVHGLEEMHGYDFAKGEYVEDMFTAGIVDPLKVIRLAIENSVSAISTLLTTNTAIIYESDKK